MKIDFGGEANTQNLLDFMKQGGNVVAVASSSYGVAISELASEVFIIMMMIFTFNSNLLSLVLYCF